MSLVPGGCGTRSSRSRAINRNRPESLSMRSFTATCLPHLGITQLTPVSMNARVDRSAELWLSTHRWVSIGAAFLATAYAFVGMRQLFLLFSNWLV